MAILLMWFSPCYGDNYRVYHNARWNFTIPYPADLLVPQGESANGDGQEFVSKDRLISMRISGIYNTLEETLDELYSAESRESSRTNQVITYRVRKNNWFVLSGDIIDDQGKSEIFYKKTILTNGVIIHFEMRYDKAHKMSIDPIVGRIIQSLDVSKVK